MHDAESAALLAYWPASTRDRFGIGLDLAHELVKALFDKLSSSLPRAAGAHLHHQGHVTRVGGSSDTHAPQTSNSRKLLPYPMHLFQLAVQDIRVVDQFFETLGVSFSLKVRRMLPGVTSAVRLADLADLIYETLAFFFKE